MSSLECVFAVFRIDIVDIIIPNEIMDQTAPEQCNFGRRTIVYECKKMDAKLLDYPCTNVWCKIEKLMENGGI